MISAKHLAARCLAALSRVEPISEVRLAEIAAEDQRSRADREAKITRAKEWLAERYLLHPSKLIKLDERERLKARLGFTHEGKEQT